MCSGLGEERESYTFMIPTLDGKAEARVCGRHEEWDAVVETEAKDSYTNSCSFVNKHNEFPNREKKNYTYFIFGGTFLTLSAASFGRLYSSGCPYCSLSADARRSISLLTRQSANAAR